MRVDSLLIAEGLLKEIDADPDLLMEAAFHVLSCGVRPTMAEWTALSPESRDAFQRANRRLNAQKTRAIAVAIGEQLHNLTKEAADHAASMIAERIEP